MQTERKKITNVENCEKTPTIKQSAYYFCTIIKWQKKKNPFPLPFFGDVIIHKTGTRLTGGSWAMRETTARTRQRSTGKGGKVCGEGRGSLSDCDRDVKETRRVNQSVKT